MQICIQWKDNSPKPVTHHLTLKEGPKVKFDNIRRFPTSDILQVGFTLQTSRTNNKGDIGTIKSGKWGKIKSFKIKCLQGYRGHVFMLYI